MARRLFAFVLAFLMLFSAMPMPALAESLPEDPVSDDGLIVTVADETSAPTEAEATETTPETESVGTTESESPAVEETQRETEATLPAETAEAVNATASTEVPVNQPEPLCGLEEHTHTENCQSVLCSKEAHTHTAKCYTAAAKETVPQAAEEETVPMTTEAETVPDTTEAETAPETTEAETVPETSEAETVPETTEAETVPVTTEAETVPETTEAETVPEETEEELLLEDIITDEAAMASYGSNLGWENATIEATYTTQGQNVVFTGYTLADTNNLGQYLTVTIDGTAVSEYNNSTKNIATNVLNRSTEGKVTVSVNTYGYYIAEMILACGNRESTPNPFKCNTKSTSDAYTFPISGTPTTVTADLSAIYDVANHGSNDDDYFIMIELGKLPDKVYVGYDAGSIDGTAITAKPVEENGAALSDGAAWVTTATAADPSWAYSIAGLTSAPVHTALGISAEAEAEANEKGYSFAGWKLEYYTTYTENSNTFSGEMSVGGTNLPKGTGVTLSVNAKLTAIWQPMIKIQVTKVWDDNDNQDGIRPSELTVKLYRGSTQVGKALTLNEDNDWTGSWNAPSCDEGGRELKEADFNVIEIQPDGYEVERTTYTPTDTQYTFGYKLINSHTPETTVVQVRKEWDDDDNRDGLRPDSVTVELYADGKTTGETLEMSASNSWTAQFENLPKYRGGAEIKYSVEETSVSADYTVGYTVDEKDGTLIVTNTHKPATTSIAVTKTWDDNNNQDGKRPDNVVFTLYYSGTSLVDKDGNPITVTITATGAAISGKPVTKKNKEVELSVSEKVTVSNDGNSWTVTIDGLLKNAIGSEGKELVYSVKEEDADVPADYSTSGIGNSGNNYTITNTHIPAVTEITVNKEWDDADDQDGKRPDEITVVLLADGEKYKEQTLTAGDNWTASFTGLPMYRDGGVKIEYTVQEAAISGYDMVDSEGNVITSAAVVDGKVVITNKHTPEVAQLNVQKVWNDANNNDGKRPYAVVITLYENGQHTENTLTLQDSNDWNGTWEDMPRYRNGQRISYTVVETGYYATKEALDAGTPTHGIPSGYTVTHSYNTTDVNNPTATVTNSYTPETINLNVQKDWEDANNQDGIRPDSITVTLWHKTSADGEWAAVIGSDGKPITKTLTATTGEDVEWDATFEKLPMYHDGYEIEYNVVEDPVSGYDVEYAFDKDIYVVTVTNTHEVDKTEISVSKEWDDADDQDGKRPDSITVSLYGINKQAPIRTATLNEGNGWSFTFGDLDKNFDGSEIIYTVTENTVTGYTLEDGSGNSITAVTAEDGTATLYNKHIPETTELSVTKVWEDAQDQDGKRPDSVTVTLYANGEAVQTLELDATGLWQGKFENLPKFDKGEEIEYTVDEAKDDIPDGYAASVNGTTITNSYTPKKTSVTVNKVWDDANDQDGLRPASVTVALYADNAPTGDTVTMDANDNWTASFTGLPMYRDGGVEIKYTVQELNVPADYEASVDGYTITNAHIPEKTSVTVNKVWDDADDQDGKRPDFITVALYADANDTGKTVTVKPDDDGNWTASFTGLPMYRNGGVKIEYTVQELNVPADYKASVDGYTITNAHIPEKTSVTVNKVWDDADDQDGKRPGSVIVTLYADGAAIRTAELTAPNWQATFSDLDKYKNGEEISYTVGEALTDIPEGYTATVNGTTITNKHIPATVDIPVSKVWDDANDQDGKRPNFVTVYLLADGRQIDQIDLDSSNSWKHTFTDLPQYAAGKEIVYTVQEAAITDYDMVDSEGNVITSAGVVDGKIVITNKHTPETVKVVATKVWDDEDDQDGKRPESITLHLLASGNHTGQKQTVTANEKGEWTVTWEDLPKYNDGMEIGYTVTESPVYNTDGDAYSVSYKHETVGNVINATITNTLEPGKTAVTVEKLWRDTYNQDGLRPTSIRVELYANDAPTGDTLDLSQSVNWIGTFSHLDEYEDGNKITYTVKEIGYTDAEGYHSGLVYGENSVTYSDDELTGDLEVVNTHEVEKTDVSVKKVWVDAENQDGIRPDAVNVTLYRNGTEVTSYTYQDENGETITVPGTVTLNEDNEWSYTWTGLDVHHGIAVDNIYTVKEESVAGYASKITGDAEKGYIITNTHAPDETEVTVTKTWNDANDQDGIRPDKITVVLLADGKKYKEQTLTADDNWTYVFTKLPKFEAGKEIQYTIKELEVKDYTTEIEGYTITNTHKPAQTSVKVTKLWDDTENQDGVRPTTLTVKLRKNGVVYKTAEISAPSWEYEFTNLPKYENGVEIIYTVDEVIQGLDSSYSPDYKDVDGGVEITNNRDVDKTTVTVQKVWADANNQDGIRPSSIQVQLLAGDNPVNTQILNAGNGWRYTWTDLDVNKNSSPIKYTVKEISTVDGYTSSDPITDAQTGVITIINTHTVQKTSVSVTKVWEDDNNRDNIRPESISVVLYKNGVKVDSYAYTDEDGNAITVSGTQTLSAKNDWSYTYAGLDVNHGVGVANQYAVVEEAVPAGYTAVPTGDAKTGYIITNTHDPETISIPVSKKWDDANDQDGIRPAQITVSVYDGSTAVQTLKLTAVTNWSGTFTGLPKYRTGAVGEEIIYTVQEAAISGYDMVDSEGNVITSAAVVDGKVVITNKHTPEVAQLNVKKAWNDANNNDGKRPYAVVITLYENGQPTEYTLTLQDSNDWNGTWKDMPRYRNGQRISYSVVETGYYATKEALDAGTLTHGIPSGYTVTHSYNTTDVNNPTATVTNSYTPETINLNIQKDWEDDNNRDNKRPAEITVTLYQSLDDGETWTAVLDTAGEPMTAVMNSANEWDADFLNLPKYSGGKEIAYKVVETPVEGYTTSYSDISSVGVITVTNAYTVSRVDVSVNKEWADNDNQDGIRPGSVQVTLYANGIRTSMTQTLSEENDWSYTWKDLYEYYNGKQITYTVVEEDITKGYTAEYATKTDEDGNVTVSIKNVHTPEPISIPVIKTWADANDQDGKRPDSITVTLYANGKATANTLTLTADDNWQGLFTGLDKYESGNEIQYSIVEEAIEGYNVQDGASQSITVDMVDGKISITNTHDVEKTTFTAVKVWDDGNDQDGKRPESITLYLLANGVYMGESYKRVLTAENGWTYTWENLNKYSNGQAIRYTVYEAPISFQADVSEAETEENSVAAQTASGYTTTYKRVSETEVTVINTYRPETTEVTIMKVWNDGGNRDGIQTASVAVTLYANGVATNKTAILNAENGWVFSWKDLPKYENHGELIKYTVVENDVPTGYDCTITQDPDVPGAFIITNTHAPATTGVSVSKLWNDEENNDGKRPDGIIVQLYADGSAVEGARVILNDANRWTHIWSSTANVPLYVYNQGKLIQYYVQEVGYVIDGVEYDGLPEGYVETTSSSTNGYNVTITNTRATEKISVSVTKKWEDDNNNDGIRPASISVTLLKNGTVVETVTLNQKNNWTYTWSNLYKYAGGVEAVYTVDEAAVSGYSATYSYKTNAKGTLITATVTNTHTTQTKSFTISKVWKDNGNIEGLRPTSVTVQVYKNGVAYGDKIILSAANNWQSPMDLPVYENGKAIEWTVKELSIPKYYSVSYDQKTLTITNTIQSTEVPKTGDYNNIWMWVLMLGFCSAGAVGVMAYDKKRKHTQA